jgi:hypothetical protein
MLTALRKWWRFRRLERHIRWLRRQRVTYLAAPRCDRVMRHDPWYVIRGLKK